MTSKISAKPYKALKKSKEDASHAKHTHKHQRFKTYLQDNVDFNRTIFVNIVYTDNIPALYVVGETKYYQAARWLPKVSVEELWRTFRLCRMKFYLGSLVFIALDTSTYLMAQAFLQNSSTIDIRLKTISVETPQSTSTIERYHAPLRPDCPITRNKALFIDAEAPLQMAVKGGNDSMEPIGLVLTFLFLVPSRTLVYDPIGPFHSIPTCIRTLQGHERSHQNVFKIKSTITTLHSQRTARFGLS